MVMNEVAEVILSDAVDRFQRTEVPCRDALRTATQEPHERLHLHAGFKIVKDGTITLQDYRALLVRLYGFYLPFERAVGVNPIRTQWLERDLIWLSDDDASLSRIGLCADLPLYDTAERQLGALYVVEGSALGGRQLYRGLDRLLGPETVDGRRFFNGRGADTGDAWKGFIDQLASVGPEPSGRTALVSAAVETFEVFETWLGGWSDVT
jgi:heme oxygenase